MGSKPPSTTTTVNKTELDPITQQAKQSIFSQANNLMAQGPPQYYPGQTFVGPSQDTQAGMGYMRGFAQQGAPGYMQGRQALQRTMSGAMPGMGVASGIARGAGQMDPSMMAQQGAQGVSGGAAGMVQGGTGYNPWQGAVAGAGMRQNQYAPMAAMAGAQGTNTQPLQPWAQGGGQNAYSGALQQMAGGSNPWLDATFKRAGSQVSDMVNSQFGAAGRTGSRAHQGQMQEGLNNLATDIYGGAYENDMARRMSAAQSLAGLDEARMGRQFDAAGQITGYNAADADRMLQGISTAGGFRGQDLSRGLQGTMAAGDLAESGFGRQLQGADIWGGLLNQDANRAYQGTADAFQGSIANNAQRLQGAQTMADIWNTGNTNAMAATDRLQGMYDYGLAPGRTMLDLGGMTEQYQGAALQSDIDRWNYGQNAQWDLLGRYANMVNGLPVQQTSQGTAVAPGGSRAAGGLGGALAGGGLAYMLGMSNPMVMGAAALGGLAGLF